MTDATTTTRSISIARPVATPGKRLLQRVEPYLYVLPAAIFVVAFLLYPMVLTVIRSFTHDDGINPAVFAGLQNFTDLFADPHFLVSLKNTFIWTIAAVVLPVTVLVDNVA